MSKRFAMVLKLLIVTSSLAQFASAQPTKLAPLIVDRGVHSKEASEVEKIGPMYERSGRIGICQSALNEVAKRLAAAKGQQEGWTRLSVEFLGDVSLVLEFKLLRQFTDGDDKRTEYTGTVYGLKADSSQKDIGIFGLTERYGILSGSIYADHLVYQVRFSNSDGQYVLQLNTKKLPQGGPPVRAKTGNSQKVSVAMYAARTGSAP